MKLPEQIIADWRGDAQRLRARGRAHDAELLEGCAAEMADALGGFLQWLPEADARLKSGRSVDYFRDHFAEWSALGLCYAHGPDCAGQLEAHHPDYSRPLVFITTCRKHHRALDRQRGSAA